MREGPSVHVQVLLRVVEWQASAFISPRRLWVASLSVRTAVDTELVLVEEGMMSLCLDDGPAGACVGCD